MENLIKFIQDVYSDHDEQWIKDRIYSMVRTDIEYNRAGNQTTFDRVRDEMIRQGVEKNIKELQKKLYFGPIKPEDINQRDPKLEKMLDEQEQTLSFVKLDDYSLTKAVDHILSKNKDKIKVDPRMFTGTMTGGIRYSRLKQSYKPQNAINLKPKA